MDEGRRDDDILWAGEPKRGWLTVWPNQVGVVMLDGNFEYTFTERKRKLPKGDVRTYVASTALFTLSFWLRDPSDPSPPSEGVALDLPVLTADGQLVTGRIDITLSVIEDNVDSLLALSGQRGAVGKEEVAQAVKGDVQAALSLGLQGKTFGDLRGDPEVFQGIRGALRSECASAVRQYGLWLRDLNVTWGLTPEEREGVKEQRHLSTVRDIEREAEIGEARPQQQPRRETRRRWAVWGIAGVAAVVVIGLGAAVLGGTFGGAGDGRTAAGPPAPAAAAVPAASEPTMTPTVVPPTAAPAPTSAPADTPRPAAVAQPAPTPTMTAEGDSRLRGNDVGGSGNDVGGSGNDVGGSGNDVGGSGNDVGGSGNDVGGATPTVTPASTAIPTATNTAIPTAIPTATVTPVPTVTPAPTATPPPTAVPTPIRGEQAGALLRTITVGGRVLSSPAVLGGTMYVGSDDGNLYAVDIASQRELWRYAAGARIASTPAVSKGVVYVGSNDRHLHAVDAASGELRWKYETGAEVFSSPAVSNGVVYVGSDDNHLYAFDAETGELRWQYETADWVSTAPAVGGSAVYVRSEDGVLHAVDTSTGEGLWQQGTGRESVSSSPVFTDGVVYAGGERRVRGFDAATGEGRFGYGTDGQVVYSPAVANGIVYAGSDDGHLYAIDASTKALLWLYDGIQPTPAPPLVAEGAVYVQSEDGHLYALDALTGTLLWRSETGGVYGGPRADGGFVYAAANGGKVYGMVASSPLATAAPSQEREAGDLLWRYWAGEVYNPTTENGIVYFGTSGSIYAINAATGALSWRYNGAQLVSVINGRVYAKQNPILLSLDAATGELLWTYEGGEGVRFLTVSGDVVYTSNADGSVRVLDATTGSLIWRYRPEGDWVGSPVVIDDTVYFGSGSGGAGYVYALDAVTGSLRWSYSLGRAGGIYLMARDGVVYVSFREGERLRALALDTLTGDALWNNVPSWGFNNLDHVWPPMVVNGVLYVSGLNSYYGNRSSHIIAIDPSTGRVLWRGSSGSAPLISDDVLYDSGSGATGDDMVYIRHNGLDPATGEHLWESETHAPLSSQEYRIRPSRGIIHDGVVYSPVAGNVHALHASTGEVLWTYNMGANEMSTEHHTTIDDGVLYVGGGRSVYAFYAPGLTQVDPTPTPTASPTPNPLQTGR